MVFHIVRMLYILAVDKGVLMPQSSRIVSGARGASR